MRFALACMNYMENKEDEIRISMFVIDKNCNYRIMTRRLIITQRKLGISNMRLIALMRQAVHLLVFIQHTFTRFIARLY